MKQTFCYVLGGLTLAFGVASPAFASKTDDAWATCLWETVPQSAANWLSMPLPERNSGMNGPSAALLLQYRLQAACYLRMIPAGKKSPPGFSAKKLRENLARVRPAEIGADKIDPKAFQCKRFFLNDTEMKQPAEYKWGFGDFDTGVMLSRIQYFFAAKGGGSVGLSDVGGLRSCQVITENGTLIDA